MGTKVGERDEGNVTCIALLCEAARCEGVLGNGDTILRILTEHTVVVVRL